MRAGTPNPRIGVCGINPHAGENGLFGRGEEESKIVPAVEAARARGWKIDGPLPADSLFYLAARGDYDLVVAMYHDQGHGPVKAMGLEHGVNVTAGPADRAHLGRPRHRLRHRRHRQGRRAQHDRGAAASRGAGAAQN